MADEQFARFLENIEFLQDLCRRVDPRGAERNGSWTSIEISNMDRAQLDAAAVGLVRRVHDIAWEQADDQLLLDLGMLLPMAAGTCSPQGLDASELAARCLRLVETLDVADV